MFFKDLDDFRSYIDANANFSFASISIFLRDVNRSVLRKYLGVDFLTELQDTFDDAPSFNSIAEGKEKDLIDHLRSCTAHLALVRWTVSGQLGIDSTGIYINSTSTRKTPWEWQIRDLQRTFSEVGYNSLDAALELLEDNIDDFETYKGSDAFKENASLFVSSSREFCKHFSALHNNRINFYRLHSIIRKVESFYIKPVLLPDLFQDLKDKLEAGETLGENAQKLMDLIRPAVVHLTVAKAVRELSASLTEEGWLVFDNAGGSQTMQTRKQADAPSLSAVANTAHADGLEFLQILSDYLAANIDDYPLHSADAKYTDPDDQEELNDEDNSFVVM